MNKKNSAYILAGLGVLLLLARRPHGVGKVARQRRNIFAEIEQLQMYGVPLSGNWDVLRPEEKESVARVMLQSGYKKLSRDTSTWRELVEIYAPDYYKQICRQYLKLVNPAIGRIQYPHQTSTIRNSRGDVVLTYNDYDPDRDMSEALSWWHDATDPYSRTVYAIAAGNKWVWKGKRKGGQLLTRGLADELFFSRTNLEGERRLYKGIIGKDGWTVDKFAEQYLGDADGAKDGALDALRDFPSPKAARQYILDQYYASLDDGMPDYGPEEYTDVPF